MKKTCRKILICLLCVQLVLPVYGAEPESSRPDATAQGTTTTQESKDTAAQETTAIEESKDAAADSNRTEAASLRIDNQNVYEGMTMPYRDGYQPVCENGRVNLILPLVSEGKLKNNRLTAAVDLGATENSPFVFKTYVKDFTCKPEAINGTPETREVFLVLFEIELNESRANGVYPIVIHVSGTDENGQAVQKSFTNYVTITDGNSADDRNNADGGSSVDGGSNAVDNGNADNGSNADGDSSINDGNDSGDWSGGASDGSAASDTPTSNPIVLVSKSVINPETVNAGDDFTATVTLENTNKKKSVQNMVVTVSVPSADFELKNGSNTFFIGTIGKGKSRELTLQLHASKTIADGNYPIGIAMSYDDAKAETCTSEGNIIISVEQPLEVQLTMPVIDKEMTAGDTVPFSFQVMNLSRSTVYNVRCDVDCDGLTQTKTAFIGNMESGTVGEGVTNVFVSTLPGENLYGDTQGVVTLTYEDAFGNEHSETYDFATSIVKMPESTDASRTQEPESASQWWISVAILLGLLLLIGCTGAAYWMGRKKR